MKPGPILSPLLHAICMLRKPCGPANASHLNKDNGPKISSRRRLPTPPIALDSRLEP